MKRKYAAMILGLTMTLTSVNMAYAATDTTTEAAVDETTDSEDASATTDNSVESTEVYGEVTEVGEDSITINVGTLKEGQQPGDGEAPKDGEKAEDGQAPEMKTEAIALTDIQVGDTIKVTLDADGNATAVVVMNAGVPEAKDGDAKGSDKKTADSKSDASETGSSDSTDSTTDTK